MLELEANLRARRFHERLGFVVTGEVSPHIQMAWSASTRLRITER
jgi:RimJ/RimL family protein N-acetyltransferase